MARLQVIQGDGGVDPIDARIHALTAQVGARVRAARTERGLSRRELSERSGVSQRYLAAVEAGEGNISVALLLKLGEALDRRVAWFVTEAAPDSDPETPDLADLLARATPQQRAAALAILNPMPPANPKAHRIALTGLRGAGKSTLGRRVAGDLGLPFVELNHRIEALGGMPVGDIIGLYGQEGYRTLERQALEQVAETHDAVVLAVAGGIVSAADTYALLLDRFHTVWLRAAPQEHMDRVRAQGDERPMAGNPKALDDLKAILTSREALYARADATLDTGGMAEDHSLAALTDLIAAQGFQA